MTDFRSMYDSNYLYSFDLKGRDVTVTIASVQGAKLRGADGKEQRKLVLFFKESKDKRGLAVPKSAVGKVIAGMYGNDIEDWVGKRVTLFPTQCEAFGKTVDCIRVRPKVPDKAKPAGQFAEVAEAPMPEAPEHAEINEREPGDE
jgi:hypothetical protein